MTIWRDVDPMLQRLLKDASSALYKPELRLDGFNAAQDVFVAHTARLSKTSMESGSSWPLPDECIELPDSIEGIQDTLTEEWLEEVRFVPGQSWSEDPRGYYIWPEKTLNLTYEPRETIDVYYYSYWPRIV